MKAAYFVAFLALLVTATASLPARADEREPRIRMKGLAAARDLQVGGDELMTTAIPVFGGGVEVGYVLDPNTKHRWRTLLSMHYEFGTTRGLRAHTILGKITGQLYLGSVARWNIGGHVAGLVIERSTVSGEVIGHWGSGLHTGFDFQLMQEGNFRLFVGPELDATILPHKLFVPRSLYVGGSLGLGARF